MTKNFLYIATGKYIVTGTYIVTAKVNKNVGLRKCGRIISAPTAGNL
ncbi:MAG: hypothetical protein FWG64_06925 [Firmicutes bacterium]|nr:hypothetical protein [Bacillota bacterium]